MTDCCENETGHFFIFMYEKTNWVECFYCHNNYYLVRMTWEYKIPNMFQLADKKKDCGTKYKLFCNVGTHTDIPPTIYYMVDTVRDDTKKCEAWIYLTSRYFSGWIHNRFSQI